MHKDKRKKRLSRKQSKKDRCIIDLAKNIEANKRYLLSPLPTLLNRAFLL